MKANRIELLLASSRSAKESTKNGCQAARENAVGILFFCERRLIWRAEKNRSIFS
jgi:hypothetical protein